MMAATATLEAHSEGGSPAGAPGLALAAQCLQGARAAGDALSARRAAPAAADKSAVYLHVKASARFCSCSLICLGAWGLTDNWVGRPGPGWLRRT